MITITEQTKVAFNLTEDDCKKITRLMLNGKSLGESLVAIGKATKKVVDCNAEKVARKTTAPRERKIDPTKKWVLDFIAIPLGGSDKVKNLVNDGSKSIDFEIDGESYTLTLTKHKKKA